MHFQVSPLDPVQLRIGLQKTGLRGSPTHRRSDSSGSSANSRDSHTELSPGRDHIEYPEYSRGCYAEPRSHDHYEENNSMYTIPFLIGPYICLNFMSRPRGVSQCTFFS